MFRVDAPLGEARDEPRFPSDPDAAGWRSAASIFAVHDLIAGRREPLPAGAVSPPPPERGPPVVSRRRTRPFGPLGSLVLHLLPLLMLIDWPLRPPPEVAPIPVQLVFQPPPPPPPAPKPVPKPIPKPRPEVRPPPGRLASEDIGDTKTKGQEQEKSAAATTAEKPPPAPAERSPEPEQQTAAIVPPPPMPQSSGLPDQALAPAPPRPKPKPASPPLLRRTVARPRAIPRSARFPGPAATRDEYLAYLVHLTRRHLNLLPLSAVGGRRGVTVIDILVADNGSLSRVAIGQSSGYPDIDRRVEAMIQAVGRFPPLPQWFQGPNMQLQFRLTFPEALEN